jgi:hypothetical protein
LTLAQDTFPELKGQSRDQISFLLPRVPETSTRLEFDDSTTWYRLGDLPFAYFDPPPILGIQCRSLFEKPKKSLMGKHVIWTSSNQDLLTPFTDEIAGIIPIMIAPIIMVMVFLAMSLGKN